MAGRAGRAVGLGLVAYVCLGMLTAGVLIGAQRAGVPSMVTSQMRRVVCGIVSSPGCPSGATPGVGNPGVPGMSTPGVGGKPVVNVPSQPPDVRAKPGNGWSGVGSRPSGATTIPWPWLLAGAAVLVALYFDVPSRLFGRRKPPVAERRRAAERRAARAAAAAQGPAPAEVVIAPIDPGLASKGMRVVVRDCEVTLRPGPHGRIGLAKTLRGTPDRQFARAGRMVRQRLKDPGFVAALLAETGRAADYLAGNPQFAGSARRQAELRSLAGALEGTGRGLPG